MSAAQEQQQEPKKPTVIDHLQALAMRYEELVRMSLPGNLGADAMANATVHATAINDFIAEMTGKNDKLEHLIQRQQEALAAAEQKDASHA